jgi:predicted amidohydrolase
MTRIALFQSQTGIDPEENARALADAIARAADGGAEMLFTPEMSGLLDRDTQRARKNLRGEGEVRARYDKIHLFDVDLPTGESWRESATYSAGTDVALINGTPVGKLGLTICYDLRFPMLFARLAEADADVIAVPAAFTVPTGRAHWHVLLRARAIEAGLFVVAAAQVGHHQDGRNTFGHSLVVDPWGEVLLDMGDEPGVGFADIDLARISDVRSRIPALNHRRPIPDAVTR